MGNITELLIDKLGFGPHSNRPHFLNGFRSIACDLRFHYTVSKWETILPFFSNRLEKSNNSVSCDEEWNFRKKEFFKWIRGEWISLWRLKPRSTDASLFTIFFKNWSLNTRIDNGCSLTSSPITNFKKIAAINYVLRFELNSRFG